MTRVPHSCVCLVTNRRAVGDARTTIDEITALERLLDEAIAAGVDLIQIRERDLEARVLAELTARVLARAASTSTRVIVNDRVDVAMATGAHGVHVRSDGPTLSSVRALCGEPWLVGRSVHAAGEAVEAQDADYLIFGTVFASGSKAPGAAVAGVTALRQAAAAAGHVPVLAIGGITPARVRECRLAGAAGIAAIAVFLPPGRASESLGASAAVRGLREAWLW